MTSQYEMRFPFTTQEEILDWENCYIEDQSEKGQEKEEIVIDFKQNVRSRETGETPSGYLLKTELREMRKWISPQGSSQIDRNREGFVEKITAKAFSLDDDWEKLEKLTEIHGVGQHVASVILHLYDSKKYPILSYPALSAVGIMEEYVRGSEYPFWQEYVNRCRAEAERYDVSMRTLDRALWKYSESGNARGHR